jgi:peptidoglycan/LPS O-acetylase OafA/YrhL
MPNRRRDVSKALDSRLPTGGRLSSIDSQEVVIVAGTLRNRPRLNILNNDGQPHPAENTAAILVLVAGLVSFVLGLVVRNAHTGPAAHIIATATGLAALLVGLYLQMVSSTRNQRVVIVAGIIAGFVGLAIGLSKGGFVG